MSAHEKAVEAAAIAHCASQGFDPTDLMPNDGPRLRYYVPGAQVTITAYLASMQEQGWVMVPREATDDMVDAARHFLEPQTERIGRACYRAMIDAAMLAAKDG